MRSDFFEKALKLNSDYAKEAGYVRAVADIMKLIADNFNGLTRLDAVSAVATLADMISKLDYRRK